MVRQGDHVSWDGENWRLNGEPTNLTEWLELDADGSFFGFMMLDDQFYWVRVERDGVISYVEKIDDITQEDIPRHMRPDLEDWGIL